MAENNENHVYSAINKVMRDIGIEGIAKDNKVEFGATKFKFRGIDDIYNALSPIIAKNDLVIVSRCIERECVERTTGKGIVFYVTVKMEFDLISSIDGSKHTAVMYGEAMDSGDKATNKAMSAAYKYMAMQVFCIPTEGDNDADATVHEVKQENEKRGFDINKHKARIISHLKEGKNHDAIIALMKKNGISLSAKDIVDIKKIEVEQ